MKDILYEALLHAVVKGLFEKQVSYDEHGNSRTYGGQLSNLARDLVSGVEQKEMEKLVRAELNVKGNKTFKDLVLKETKEKATALIKEKLTRNHYSQYDFNEKWGSKINALMETAAKDFVKKNEDKIRKQVGILLEKNIKSKDFSINVELKP